MHRYILMVLIVLGTASPTWANTWAEGLYEELKCDFGSVPRGQVLVHLFRMTNNTKSTVHIFKVTVSCGCTKAWALQSTLAPGQESAVIAQMDTRVFGGVRSVNIQVDFDTPTRESVNLSVTANSRSDLFYFPDALNFAKIKKGVTPTTQVEVNLVGMPQTQITEVKCDSNYIQPKLQELRRDATTAIYLVSATVRADIPEGKWYTTVWLTTNNAAMPLLRVPLAVEVEAPPPPPPPAPAPAPPPAVPGSKTSAPSVVVLPAVKQGVESNRKVILSGTQPFRITNIQGEDQELIVRPVSLGSQTVHELTLTFRPSQTGQVNRLIRVTTDMSNNREIEINAQTQIVP
jgi:Protein of unknown function (DUF1573)